MSRGLGVVDALQGALPEGAAVVLSTMTQLGDTWFVVLLVALVYWFRDRDTGALAFGLLLGGIAIVLTTKAAFGLPRPPESVRLAAADGYGFPSGHAIAATVAWGTLALTLEVWTRRRRFAVAGAAVALVAFTRVALGVHFAVDVLAGVAVGGAYLAGTIRWCAGRPTRALGTAVALSALAVVATAGGRDATLLLGVSAGALAAVRSVDVPREPWRGSEAIPGLVVGVLAGGVLLAGYLADGPLVLAAAFGFAGGFAVIATPAVAAETERSRSGSIRG